MQERYSTLLIATANMHPFFKVLVILIASFFITYSALYALVAHAQIVPAQNQIIIAPYGSPTVPSYVVSTSTSGTKKLEATTSPYFATFFAGTGTLQNLILGALNGALYAVNGVVKAVATTTATCSGTVSCTSFDVFGPSPITIIGSGSGSSAFEIATTTDIAVPQVAYFTKTSGRTTLGSVATGTVSNGAGISVTAGRSVLGGALTITNTGVTALAATSPLNTDASTGSITISCATCLTAASGVTSITAGSGISTVNSVGAVTIGNPNSIATSSSLALQGVAYITKVSGMTTIASAATTTLAGTGVTSVSNVPFVIGASPAVVSIIGGATSQVLAWLNGVPTWTSTTTAGTGLTFTPGTPGNFSVNTTQNITRLSNLVTDGFVQTTGGNGTLTSALLTSAQVTTALGFTPFGIANPLPIANGGTATTTFYDGGIAFYNSTLGTLSQASRANTNQDINWDRTNGRLGIGTTTPSAQVSINPNGITGDTFAIGSTTKTLFHIENSGAIGIGTSSSFTSNACGIFCIDGATGPNGAGRVSFSLFGSSAFNMTLGQGTTAGITGDTGRLFVISNHPLLFGTSNVVRQMISAAGDVGIGTSTPQWRLTVASSTGPQLTLTDASLTSSPFNLRSISGNLFFSTSSPTTYATTTPPFLSFTGATGSTTIQKLDVTGGATSTFTGGIAITGGGLRLGNITGSAQCLHVDTNGAVTGTGSDCGSGGGGTPGGTGTELQFRSGASTFGAVTASGYTIATNNLGIGTTTPKWLLQLASSTGPQLTLSDPTDATNNHWSFRNENGTLVIGTSSPLTYATSSAMQALTIFGGPLGARVGINDPVGTAPRATLDLYEQNGTGATPSVLFGGNSGGDTDFWLSRISDNSGTDNDFFQIGRDTVPGTNPMVTLDNIGRLGIGSTTPWGILSVASSTYSTPADYARPLFAVSTSTAPTGQLFSVFATTTTMVTNITTSIVESGVRVGIGLMNSFGGTFGLTDALTVGGTINNQSWIYDSCGMGTGVSLTADGLICGPFKFHEDNNGTVDPNGSSGGNYIRLRVEPSVLNNGASIVRDPVNTFNQFSIGTSTPKLEAVIRPNGAATSTTFYIGLTDTMNASSIDATPANGCYFAASSTSGVTGTNTGNWQAICTSGGVQTEIDTGIASSTVIGAFGQFRRFKLETSSSIARFYIQPFGGIMSQVAQITTNIPTSNVLSAGVAIGATTQGNTLGTTRTMDISSLKLWYRDLWMP